MIVVNYYNSFKTKIFKNRYGVRGEVIDEIINEEREVEI